MLLRIAALTKPRRGVVVRSSGDRAWAAGVLQPRPQCHYSHTMRPPTHTLRPNSDQDISQQLSYQ